MNLMKKKISVIAASMLFVCAGLCAQNFTLDDVCASLTKHAVTTGNFVQKKTSASLKKPLTSSGTFIISREGILWNTKKPYASQMAVTESKIIQTLPSGKKTVMDGSSNEIFKTVSKTVSSLFSGSKNSIEQNFNIVKFEATASAWSLVLEPKDSTIAQVLKQVSVEGERKNSSAEFSKMNISQTDTEIFYEFTDRKYKDALSAEEKLFFAE